MRFLCSQGHFSRISIDSCAQLGSHHFHSEAYSSYWSEIFSSFLRSHETLHLSSSPSSIRSGVRLASSRASSRHSFAKMTEKTEKIRFSQFSMKSALEEYRTTLWIFSNHAISESLPRITPNSSLETSRSMHTIKNDSMLSEEIYSSSRCTRKDHFLSSKL